MTLTNHSTNWRHGIISCCVVVLAWDRHWPNYWWRATPRPRSTSANCHFVPTIITDPLSLCLHYNTIHSSEFSMDVLDFTILLALSVKFCNNISHTTLQVVCQVLSLLLAIWTCSGFIYSKFLLSQITTVNSFARPLLFGTLFDKFGFLTTHSNSHLPYFVIAYLEYALWHVLWLHVHRCYLITIKSSQMKNKINVKSYRNDNISPIILNVVFKYY